MLKDQARREWVHMTYHGFKLIIGDFLARSVRGIPCSPPFLFDIPRNL
ncbi:hypothetical protein ACVWZT_004348 [Pseudomonas sp. TE21394]